MTALARAGRHAAGLAEQLCVDGQHLMAEELREACEALDALVEHFGGRRRRAASATRENSASIRENRHSKRIVAAPLAEDYHESSTAPASRMRGRSCRSASASPHPGH